MTSITFRGIARDFRANLADLLEYDKKYKWLECGMCHEMTPAERYVIGAQSCISCANKEAADYRNHKDKLEADKKWFTMHQGDNYEDSNV